jgi:iron-sulfur cluster assembly protein
LWPARGIRGVTGGALAAEPRQTIEQAATMNFQVTPTAAQEILAAAARSNAAGLALRVAARQLADGSLDYGMGFDEAREDDHSSTVAGLNVLVGAHSQPLLDGTVLDFVELAPGRFDFIFVPPAPPVVTGLGGCSTGAAAQPAKGCGTGACGACGG